MSWFRRPRDDRSAQIVDHLAAWVAAIRSHYGADTLAARIAEQLLFEAADIHFQNQTDRMDSTAAVRSLRRRIEAMVADVMQMD